jgi:hypothetical protein
MASITLNALANVNSQRNNANIYSDLHLDLAIGSTYNNQLYKQQQIQDVQSDTNLGAIFNSIASIITTSPGQKPLNPAFGVAFGDILFLPVTEERALTIGNAIFRGIQTYEPRITLSNLNITPDPDNYKYTINLTITVPRFNTQQITLNGILDKTGFYFNN